MTKKTKKEMTGPIMFRQGDVLLIQVKEKVDMSKAEEVKREDGKLILAKGEATGHHHAISSVHAAMYTIAGFGMLLKLKEQAELYHQEHSKIDLPKGDFKVTIQKEYSPGEWRDVRD
jgi:hypothetical protein